ncbi:MAG: uracil phosphoribosyltransferase [Deltaproteobacteria bacterium]|nr:uracil phosphoribosyltransferase [Deltaproteobacteria bacterium]
MPELNVIDHPLVQHKLTLMRTKDTSSNAFRRLLREISVLMTYEVTRDMPIAMREIETPICSMKAPAIDGKKLVCISVLRAGGGILEGVLEVVPSARVGHIGLYRDPKTLQPVEYYFRIPPDMDDRDVIVVDPMLATGNSAVAAVDRIKKTGPRTVKFMALVAAPEGVAEFHKHHPDVAIWTAALDEKLNEKGYIVPGLGDAGDRIFGTQAK